MEAFFAEEISIYRKRRSEANIVISYQLPLSPSEPRFVAFFRIRATGSTVSPPGGAHLLTPRLLRQGRDARQFLAFKQL